MLKRYGAISLALASLLFLASSFAAETKLFKAVTDHFELYTTDNEAAAKAALEHFEAVRAYLLKTTNGQDPFTGPIRIVAFKSGGEFSPYIPRSGDPGARAFSTASAERATIVMSGTKKEDYEYATREFVMQYFDKAAPKMPYWLKFGFSELYGTLHVDASGNMVMGSPPARGFRASISPDFDMGVMFGLTGGLSRNKGSAEFYAESSQTAVSNSKQGAAMANMEATSTIDYPTVLWYLTHMLMFQKPYNQKFGAFVSALLGGQETPAAVEQVLGQSLAGLKGDLLLYMKLASHATISRPLQLDKPVAPQDSQLSAAESALILAELKAAK